MTELGTSTLTLKDTISHFIAHPIIYASPKQV